MAKKKAPFDKSKNSKEVAERIKQSIYIDKSVYEAFQHYCDTEGYILSRKLESILKEFLEKNIK